MISELHNINLDERTRQNRIVVLTCVTAGSQEEQVDAPIAAAAPPPAAAAPAAAALQIHGTGDRNATW